MKKFVSGLIIGAALMVSTSIFAESTMNIEAVFGRVKLMVDGNAVDEETLLYNDTIYVPLNATVEALGKEVSYDDEAKIAYIVNAAQEQLAKTPTRSDTPVSMEQLKYDLNILPPNSIGTRYIETAYTNNTNKSFCQGGK